jgi:hypothetical protein
MYVLIEGRRKEKTVVFLYGCDGAGCEGEKEEEKRGQRVSIDPKKKQMKKIVETRWKQQWEGRERLWFALM